MFGNGSVFGNGYMQFVIGFASAVSVIAMAGNPYLKAVLQYAFQELIDKKRRSYITGTLDQIKPCHGVPSLVKSIDSAILILQIARSADQLIRNDPDIDEFFLQLNEVAINSNRIARQGFGNTKVLCIEGLSGSGKSTLVQGLTAFAGVRVVGPMATANLERILDLFSGSPEPVLTALCFALNYCTAHRIISETTAAVSGSGKAVGQQQGERLVVVDQFYHSVCARTVCANVGCDVDLKSLPASAFEWPLDLPTPSLVIFLSVSPSDRSRRISDRAMSEGVVSPPPSPTRPVGGRFTPPVHPAKSAGSRKKKPFWQSLLFSNISEKLHGKSTLSETAAEERSILAYSLIPGPPTIALDASQGAEDVLSAALEACEEFGLHIPQVSLRKKTNKRVSMGVYGDLPMF